LEVRSSYDSAADAYAEHLFAELADAEYSSRRRYLFGMAA
jgi:hypothetical protein